MKSKIEMQPKKVLIAHQSTIPHYRVPFYNALERLRPAEWRFEVVFDSSETKTRRFFKEPLATNKFQFPVLETGTVAVKLLNKTVSFQTFCFKAAAYDLLIVENALNNLAYPFCQLYQLTGKQVAYWGHDRDRKYEKLSTTKQLAEKLKLLSAQKVNGFFAYTDGVKANLVRNGVPSGRIVTLNNTIDILEQRRAFEKWWPERDRIKQDLKLHGKKVLLFVGRFTANKRIDYLLESLAKLRHLDPTFHLLLVGSGGETYLNGHRDGISYLGPIVNLDKLGPIYAASDLFVFPGSVGLGPLQALCYDLPVITIDSATHMPEIEYLQPENSVILPANNPVDDFAQTIINLFANPERLADLRAGTWPSIKHLTIDRMAENFIRGVNTLLNL